MAFRFLHCSDIHLLDLEGERIQRFLNKRLTGLANLVLSRRRKHDDDLFTHIVEAAQREKVDRLIVTGDVSNLALDSEFELVRKRLGSAGVPVTVIPGNHDAYVAQVARAARFEHFMNDFMQGERVDDEPYPFVQTFEGVAVVGVSTAVATLPLHATGVVGAQQLQRLRTILISLAERALARVVLIHHPVLEGMAKKRHDLLDRTEFRTVVEEVGAELVLHGHEHKMLEGTLNGPQGPIPVHGISSGTSLSQHDGRQAAFSIYEHQPQVSSRAFARRVYTWDGNRFVPPQP